MYIFLLVASTTRLNTPGTALAEMDGVHAATDVTGFGLLGHGSEMARGAGVRIVIHRASVPVFARAQKLARSGVKTGASGRNWQSVKALVEAGDIGPEELDLLCDPQTSGGLLVSCRPDVADKVLALFARHGHEGAAIVGCVETGPVGVTLEA